MFPYDADLLAAIRNDPRTVPEVLDALNKIDAICADRDGLKWFNRLYRDVTQAISDRVNAKGFKDPKWIASLDVHFARLYLAALRSSLSGLDVPRCWRVLFASRGQANLARIQFALAGMNSHINHDLAQAIVTTCRETGTTPAIGGPRHGDYTDVNTTLFALVDSAQKTLSVRLLGDALPPLSHLEDTIASWNVAAARESAWLMAGQLWHFRAFPPLTAQLIKTIDGFTTVINKTVLVPVPVLLS